MSIVTLPLDIPVVSQTFGLTWYDLEHSNPDTGASQVKVLGPPRRTCSIVGNEREDPEAAPRWRALVHALRGRVNQLAVYDLLNSEPRGSARGAWTAAATAAAGAATLSISVGAAQDGRTLLQGDWIGVNQAGTGRQLLHVQADAVAAGGLLVVSVEPVLRLSVAAGSPIVWDRPTCLMRRTTRDTRWTVRPGELEGGFGLDLQESWE